MSANLFDLPRQDGLVLLLQADIWVINACTHAAGLSVVLHVCVQYQVIKKLRTEVLALKGDIDTLQRLQQENHQPEKLVSQQSM